MLAFCDCPEPVELVDIPAFTCGENLGQIQKLIFQKRQSTATFATATAAGTLANWTALLGAADATKVTSTPRFAGFTIPGSEAQTEGGGDNSTIDGLVVVLDGSAVRAQGEFANLPAAIFKVLKGYNCFENLTVFMVNEFKKIVGYSANGTTVAGIPIYEWFIGDKAVEGKGTRNKNIFNFSLPYGWSENIKIVTPVDFDPRFDI